MISDFFNNLFNDKKPTPKPAPKPKKKKDTVTPSRDEAKGIKGGKKVETAPTTTSWLIQGHDIPVEIHREYRKNVRVSFGKDRLILRSSRLISPHEEAKAIAQLKDAITLQIEKKPELLSRFSQKLYKNGDVLTVNHKTYFVHIDLEERQSHSGKLGKNGIIQLRLSQSDTEGGRQKVIPTLLSRIISQDNHQQFSRRVLELNHQFFKKPIKSINFKYNHSNWGSCSSTGNLNFSSRLLFAPEEVQDYVIIHELAHLIELNHSDRFWKLVSDAMPDYAQKEKWLKVNGHICRF